MTKEQSPWCRGVEGQEHQPVYLHRYGAPNCQPLRRWRREDIEKQLTEPPNPRNMSPRAVAKEQRWLDQEARYLRENWECFHHTRCARCRKTLKTVLWADECPVALGLEPAGPPDPE